MSHGKVYFKNKETKILNLKPQIPIQPPILPYLKFPR